MIRVTVELIPKGDESKARILGTMEITNDATGSDGLGNYNGTLKAEYIDRRKGHVREFRRREQSVWSLVGAFLKLWGHTKHSHLKMSK